MARKLNLSKTQKRASHHLVLSVLFFVIAACQKNSILQTADNNAAEQQYVQQHTPSLLSLSGPKTAAVGEKVVCSINQIEENTELAEDFGIDTKLQELNYSLRFFFYSSKSKDVAHYIVSAPVGVPSAFYQFHTKQSPIPAQGKHLGAQYRRNTSILDDVGDTITCNIQVIKYGVDGRSISLGFGKVSESLLFVPDVAPIVELSNVPKGISNSVNLDVLVSNSKNFKYAIVSGSNKCDSATYGNAQQNISNINANISDATQFPDGTLKLCVITASPSGSWQNAGEATVAQWTKDTTSVPASNIVLTGVPQNTSNTNTLDVKVSGTDITSYRFKLASVDCRSDTNLSASTPISTSITQSLTSIPDGLTYLCVKAIDDAENESDARVVSWTKDTAAPIANLANTPASISNALSLNIAVGNEDVIEYQYALVNSGSCSSATYSNFQSGAITDALGADANYILCVKGKDAAGNIQAEATSYAWTKDVVAPFASDINLSNLPSGTNNTVSLNTTVSGAVSYRYKIATSDTCSADSDYSAADIAIATSITNIISSLSDGPIFLCVRAKDEAGNFTASADAKKVSWTKDTTAPSAGDIVVFNEPTGSNNVTALDITVSGISSYRYKISITNTCSTDDGYSSSDVLVSNKITNDISGLDDGPIFLCIRAKDAVGNLTASANAKVLNWTKNTAVATATLTGTPSEVANDTALNITVGGTDVEKYIYALLGPNSTDTCTNATYTAEASAIVVATPITNALGADGSYLLCVKGISAGGSVQQTATSYDWSKDVVAPVAADITLTNTPTGTNNTTTLNIAVSGVVSYRYKLSETDTCAIDADYSGLDIAIATSITNSITSLNDGPIYLCVRAKDAAGNLTTSANAKVASWTKDTTAPVAADISLANAPENTSNTTELDVTVSGVSSYRYKIATTHTCATDTGYSGADVLTSSKITNNISALAEGTIFLCVRGKDDAGNLTSAADAKVVSWTKDTLAPTASLAAASVPSSTSNATSLNVTVEGANVTHYIYALLGPDSLDTCSSATYTASASKIAVTTPVTDALGVDGAYILCVKGVDDGENTQSTATSYAWAKDVAVPTASDITLSNLPVNPSSVSALDMTVGGSGIVGYQYSLTTQATTCADATYGADRLIAVKIEDALSDGALRLCVRGKDAAGNLTAAADAKVHNWTQDTHEPQAAHITLSGTPGPQSNVTPLSVTVSAHASWTHSNFTQFNYAVVQNHTTSCDDGSVTYNGWSSSTALTPSISTDGNKRLCVLVRTASGKETSVSQAKVFDWVFDTTSLGAADISLSGTPTDPSKDAALAVTVGGTGLVSYQYALTDDVTACSGASFNGSWVNASTNITTGLGSDGEKKLCVIAKDAAGNETTLANAKSFSWKKDTSAPAAGDITLSGTPPNPSNATSINVTVGGTEVVKYKFALTTQTTTCDTATYSATWAAVTTSITETLGPDDNLRLCVIAQDAALNETAVASAKQFDWVKDTTAPVADDVTLTGTPTDPSNATALNVTVSGTSIVEYQYSVTTNATACSDTTFNGTWIAVATPITASTGSDADKKRLCVIVKDTAANALSAASAKIFDWKKDTVLPTSSDTTLSGTPDSTSNATSLNVTVGGTDIVDYKFAVITSGTCSAATYSASWISIATPITSALGADANYTLCVAGRDASLNAQLASDATSYAWIKDVEKPVAADVTLTGTPADPSNGSGNLAVTVGGTGVLSYQHVLTTSATACTSATYNGTWIAVSTNITTAIGTDANKKRLCVIAMDAAGNAMVGANDAAKSYDWLQETVEPEAAHIVLTGTPNARSNVTPLAITASAAGGWSGTSFSAYNYAMVNSHSTPCDDAGVTYNGWNVSASIAPSIESEGNKRICVLARTAAGNETTKSNAKSYDWVFDTTAPVAVDVVLSNTPTSLSKDTALNVTVAADTGADVESYKFALTNQGTTCASLLDGDYNSSPIAIATPITAAIGSDGTRRLCVIGFDNAGNGTKANAKNFDWIKDATTPTATDIMLSGLPSSPNTTDAQLNVTISGAEITEYQYAITTDATECTNATYNGSWVAKATALTATIGADANKKRLCVIARDAAENAMTAANAKVYDWVQDWYVANPVGIGFSVPVFGTNADANNPNPTVLVSGVPANTSIAIYLDSQCQTQPVAIIPGGTAGSRAAEIRGLNEGTNSFYFKSATNSECEYLGQKGVTNPVYIDSLVSTKRAFAAKLKNGSVVCWGDSSYGGSCTDVDFNGDSDNAYVTGIYAAESNFMAALSDGTAVCWGSNILPYASSCRGADINGPSNNLTIANVYSADKAFSAKLSDGSMVCMGDPSKGGDCSAVDFNGSSNTATVSQVYGIDQSFAAVLSDGTAVCWGDSTYGGNCSSIDFNGASNTATISQLVPSDGAFAARLSDGTAVCWGDYYWGGHCSALDLNGASNTETVTNIYSSNLSFVASLSDGTAVCWGNADTGGDCSSVDFNGASNTATIAAVYSTKRSYMARLSDGTAVCWGDTSNGGNCSSVDFNGASNSATISTVYSNTNAFMVKLSDNTVVCWGGSTSGGNCSGVDFNGVSNTATIANVYTSGSAFMVTLSDGTSICWGNSSYDGNCSSVDFNGASNSEIITAVYSNDQAFLVKLSDESIICWGNSSYGGKCDSVDLNGSNGSAAISAVYANPTAYVAVLNDGSAVCWGDATAGGDCSSVDFNGASNTATVSSIYLNNYSFAALLSDGTAVCWGNATNGGNCAATDFNGASNTETISAIHQNYYAYLAILTDGTGVCWGDATKGGDCSAVDFNGASNTDTVQGVHLTRTAFTSRLSNGSAVCWGEIARGGDCSSVDFNGASNSATVTAVYSNNFSFAAKLSDQTFVCWGNSSYGGNCSSTDFNGASNTETVSAVYPIVGAFAAQLTDGTMVCWGNASYGGDCTAVDFNGASNTSVISQIYSSHYSLLAKLSDGTAVCWGYSSYGGNCSTVDFNGPSNTETITAVYGNLGGFMAQLSGGSVVCWGDANYGHNCTSTDFNGASNNATIVEALPLVDDYVARLSDNTIVFNRIIWSPIGTPQLRDYYTGITDITAISENLFKATYFGSFEIYFSKQALATVVGVSPR